jgi:hypothetical protein
MDELVLEVIGDGASELVRCARSYSGLEGAPRGKV